jgi:hypothetical protein
MPRGVKGSAQPKAAKPAKAKAGHNQPPAFDKATFLEFRRQATHTLRALEEAQSAHQHVLKKCKAAGGSPKALMKAIRAARDPDAAKLELEAEIRYRNWIGLPVGTQSSLFGEESPDEDSHLSEGDKLEELIFQAGEAGYRQGRLAAHRSDSNTFPPGTETHVAYDKGWLRGQESIAAEMGPNVKKVIAKRGTGGAEEIVH